MIVVTTCKGLKATLQIWFIQCSFRLVFDTLESSDTKPQLISHLKHVLKNELLLRSIPRALEIPAGDFLWNYPLLCSGRGSHQWRSGAAGSRAGSAGHTGLTACFRTDETGQLGTWSGAVGID